jgi:hypothetical protein
MELVTHFEGSGNPYIVWKNSVHRSSKRAGAPFLGHAHAGGLSARMNSRICPSGADDRESLSAQLRHCGLENTLNRPLAWLSLPAGKARAIVVQHQLHGTRQHPREIIPGRPHVKKRNPLEMIDFRVSARQCAAARNPGCPHR